MLNALPNSVSTPELNIKMQEGEHYALIDRLRKPARFDGASEVITIDGLRVEYPDGFWPGPRLEHHAGDCAAL